MDQKLAGEIKQKFKGLILVITKWDLVEDKDSSTQNEVLAKLQTYFDFVSWAPVIFVSSESGQNVTKIFDIILEINKNRLKKLPTAKLNNLLAKAQQARPPAGMKKTNPRLRYITQTTTSPPTFSIFGSQTEGLHFSYLRYLERQIREQLEPFIGTPIAFSISDRDHDNYKKGTKIFKSRNS